MHGRKWDGEERVGTLERTYGHPHYLAINVRFVAGSAGLHWFYELQGWRNDPPTDTRGLVPAFQG